MTTTIPLSKTRTIHINFPITGERTFTLLEFPQKGLTESVGFHLYDASILLSQYLAFECKPCIAGKEKSVLELGSGSCGLAGLAMTYLNYQVTFSDRPALLPSLLINFQRNANNLESHKLVPLAWGDIEEAKRIGQFDIVIGADVVYQKDFIVPLLQTIYMCSKKLAFICSEVREAGLADGYFVEEAKKIGFKVTRVKPKNLPSNWNDDTCMRVYKLQKLTES